MADVAPGRLQLVQRFINTADREASRDDLATPGTMRDWLVEHRLLDADAALDAEDHGQLLDLREGLRDLLGAEHDEASAATARGVINRLATGAPLVVRFADASAELQPVVAGALATAAALLSIVYEAMVDGSWSRLKVCRRRSCRWAFYDASKNRSGAWCSMQGCGNREKVRAYQQRRRAAAR